MSENKQPAMEHASRPGFWSYVVLAMTAIGFAMIVNGPAVKIFFESL